jgi:hypothetical protein
MKWKRIGLGLGGLFLSGLALGSTVVLSRKRKQPETLPPPWLIPENPGPFSIVTEELEWAHENQRFRSTLEYYCQPTQFRVWRLMDLDLYRVRREGNDKMSGHPVFHVTPKLSLRDVDEKITPVDEERFYATIHAHRGRTETTLASCVQVGRNVEFRKCHVGGALNGIETGERLVSMAPVKEVRGGTNVALRVSNIE